METTSGSRNFLPRRCRKTKSPSTWKIPGSRRGFTFPLRMKSGRGRLCGKLWKALRPSRVFSVAHSKQAAIGFRVHSGSAAAVAGGVEKGSPAGLARQRVPLVETFTYGVRQPYNPGEK